MGGIEHLDVGHLIDEVETAWIPMADGRQLAARLFLPRTAHDEPVPVILEYIPYRRRDGTRLGDEHMHRWFAAHGYASVRVDIAGMGDSDGHVEDEYARREQDDGVEVIAWLAAQPWSTGAVGMIGISWGGFNGLQIAARRPPALAAVISLCSTVDRYHGDVHYTGGCLNEENLEWGGYFFAMHGFPPDPEIVGERWRDMWLDRIEHAILPPAGWLEHQHRDDFWKHGSVIEDLSAIEVPVLAVSGWADGYTGTVFDLVEGLGALGTPCKGIVGPWGHKYPQDGVPGPAIGFLQEATRWWDRWLRGVDTGVTADPDMRLWLEDSITPVGHVPEHPGRWIGIDRWPAGGPAAPQRWRLADGRLRPDGQPGDHAAVPATTIVRSPVTTGMRAGQWCAYGLGKIAPELPVDQRHEDAGSACFDTAPLDEPLHVVGRATVRLTVSSDRPAAQVVVRVCDVHPDGTSERLAYGVLNLCHHRSHEHPQVLVPGEPVEAELVLTPIAHTVPAGHRLRVAVSNTYWPMLWPSPERTTLTLHHADGTGGCVLDLPVIDDPHVLADDLFDEPQDARAGRVTVVRPGPERRWTTYDLDERRTNVVASRDDGVYVLDDIGTEQSFTRVRSHSIVDDDPLSATATVRSRATYRRGDWDVRVEADISMRCTVDTFVVEARLAGYDQDQLAIERHWHETIERRHV
ncbi:MAG: CocE/NonD family hydrolase [Acidimicrobiales bacterium]|nr:CocE/NonD family hydrolase [Acidimicrobiales bacterium]MCB9392264.1 CocE/NonD family hydrolase [Acidimicrobiaceae bacterium]